MATTQTLFQFPQFFTDNTGNPLNGGSVYFYQANSSTPQNTYSDRGLTVLNPNPIPLNSAGFPIVSNTEVKIYPLSAAYKVIVKDANGVTLHTWDFLDPNAPYDILSVANLTGVTITDGDFEDSMLSVSGLFGGIAQGRLTLTSLTPVTSGNVTGATTIYYTPYIGNNIVLPDPSGAYRLITFTELSLALGTLTASLPYDIFASYNTLTGMQLESPVAWTNTTTRATALAMSPCGLVSSANSLFRYLGTFYTTSTTQTADATTGRYLWNCYNRVTRRVVAGDATDNWNYTTATFRQANANTANQVNLVQGLAEEAVSLTLSALCLNSGGGVQVNVGIGENSTTVNTGFGGQSTAATTRGGLSCSMSTIPAIGYNYYAWLEYSAASGTTTWYGDNGGALFQAGLMGTWKS